LIGTRYAITAAHCFGKKHKDFPVEIDGTRHQVINTIRNPCFGNNEEPIESDIAIIELDSDSTATPAPVFQSVGAGRGDEIGQEMHVLGWGGSGPIGTVNQKNAEEGIFHAGRNTVYDIWNGMIKYRMRAPGDGALDLEAMGWDGDSGGPAFIEVGGELHVAGVNSYGDCCSYGNFDFYTRLGGVAYEWI